MTNEEAERARAADNNRLKEEVDRKLSSKELEQEQKARSSERKQQREAATTALQSGNVNLQEIARQGGSLGRKIEREVRRFEATGRVSSWLAGETLKAEAAQNAAQQSAFRQAVVDVVSTIQAPLLLTPTSPIFLEDLHEKPEIKDDVDGSILRHPWKILLRTIPDTDPPEYEFKVESASRLYSGLASWDDIEVDGLDEWANASEGYVVLLGVVENGECTEASIQRQSTLSDRIDFVDSEQNSFTAQLGYIYEQDEVLLVRQNAFHNFTLTNICVNGRPAIYPFAT